MAHADVTWAYSIAIAPIQIDGRPSVTAASMKAVLVALADCRNGRTGQCNPSQKLLAERTALSVSTVNRALAGLEQHGLIERRANPLGGGGRAADHYELNPTNFADDELRSARDSQPANVAESGDELRNPQRRTSQSANLLLYTEPEGTGREPELSEGGNDSTFDDFWSVWPRKDSKRAATIAWSKAVKRASPEVIIAAARAYAEHPNRPETKFVPYGATWLNGERWNDPLPVARTAASSDPDERVRRTLQLAAELANGSTSTQGAVA